MCLIAFVFVKTQLKTKIYSKNVKEFESFSFSDKKLYLQEILYFKAAFLE